jgi:hypothetical protein
MHCRAYPPVVSPVTVAVTTSNVVDPSIAAGGSVCLRGVAIALDSEVGKTFIIDCCRNLEGLLTDGEIKSKYELTDEVWGRLAGNTPLLRAVRAEWDRRIHNGEAAREAAQRHFARAPGILSRFGSYDSERWLEEPYFAALPTFEPRMGFAAAVQYHGMWELQMRFPELSEAELKVALSWPLDVLKCLLDHIVPPERTFKIVQQCAASYGVH